MNIAIFTYSAEGVQTGQRISSAICEHNISAYAPERYCAAGFSPIPSPSSDFYKEMFDHSDALIYVGACGIAVRTIAPYIHSKLSDPAVLCIDDKAQYIIPLLSGHIGGANRLAKILADRLGSQPIITTATDIHHRFSVDSWAVENNYLLDDLSLTKEISAAILERDIPFSSQFPVSLSLPDGLYSDSEGSLGIFLGWEKQQPYDKTLRIIPKCLHLGIGCRKGTSEETIRNTVMVILANENIDLRALKCAASINLKEHEPGLLTFCDLMNLPCTFYTAEELQSVPGNFQHSDFVQSVTGVDNVCERAAMMHADKLILSKRSLNGVTVALGAELKEVHFE